MARKTADVVLDAPLDYIANNATKMIACAGEPASYTAATGSANLAEVSVSSADFTKSDGDISGRKATVASKAGVSVTADGTADHVAIVDDNTSALLYVTVATAQTLTSGNTMDFQSWDIEFRDPSAP